MRAKVVADEPAIEVVDEQVAVGVAGRAAEAAVAALPDEEIGAVDDGVAVEVGGQAEEFGGNLPADVGEGGVVERGEKLAFAEGERRAERRLGLRAGEKRRAGDARGPVLAAGERNGAAIERLGMRAGKGVVRDVGRKGVRDAEAEEVGELVGDDGEEIVVVAGRLDAEIVVPVTRQRRCCFGRRWR